MSLTPVFLRVGDGEEHHVGDFELSGSPRDALTNIAELLKAIAAEITR